MNWQRLKSIVIKEIIQIKRDPASLAIVFVMPVVMLLLFGYAVTTDVDHISMTVFDQAKSRESRQIIAAFENSGFFDVSQYTDNYQEIRRSIDAGTAKTGLVIPPDYSRNIHRNQPAQLQLIVDGSDPLVARTALNTAQVIAQNRAFELKIQTIKKAGLAVNLQPSLDMRTRVWFNPNMESVKFNVPGLIGLIMQNITMLLTAFALVRERERGTLEQLIITPVRSGELIVGKMIPYVVIAFMDVIIILLVGMYWFDVPVKGSIPLLLSLSFLFLLAALGFGMFISTVAKTQLQAMQMSFLIILPSVLLSGFMFPREAMPKFIQFIGYLLPLTYFLKILRGIVLKGIGAAYMWNDILFLAVFGVGILALAAFRLKKRLD